MSIIDFDVSISVGGVTIGRVGDMVGISTGKVEILFRSASAANIANAINMMAAASHERDILGAGINRNNDTSDA